MRVSDQAVCPYYKREERQMVYCEGVDDESVIHLAFPLAKQLKEHKKKHCEGCWYGCPIAGMLNKKWGYEIGS